ncbi:MAG: hypothetical protein GC206_04005 [Alphaproteobacteria bacterium]|nr:hypothetical protein [Alphaproteobacteria bacterium]
MRNPWGGQLTRAAVLKAAERIAREDKLERRAALRRALAWARRKAKGDRYAAARAEGVYSPRNQSAEARDFFAQEFKRYQGRRGTYKFGD